MAKTSPTITAHFGGYTLEDSRLYQGPRWTDITGAHADWRYEPSNKGPDVGRAFLGLIGGAIIGALVGFLLIGGIIAVAVVAIVIGLVMGLTPVEHANSYVTVTYPTGHRVEFSEGVARWEHARYMAQEINRAAGTADSPPAG